MHPHLLLTREPVAGLRSVDDVRRAVESGFPKRLWEMLLAELEADLAREPHTPASLVPGRTADTAALRNRDYGIVSATCMRMKRAALAWLLTEDARFKTEALRQAEAVFDERLWPEWVDQAHLDRGLIADLRTGQFLRAFGYVYDWLHDGLTASERAWLVEHLDRRAIRPYLEEQARGTGFLQIRSEMNNWSTCVVGGAGTAAMALGGAHPDSARMLAHAVELMEAYLGMLGPEGEHNESVGYSGSMHFPIEFFTALRYHTGGGENRVGGSPFTDFCRWYMYFILPPGRTAAFGDSHPDARPATAVLPAVAAAARDGVLQWFYEQYARPEARGDLVLELLFYDPDLPAVSPEGRVPHGRAFRGHGQLWSSRTDWNPESTACVVYGKGGRGIEGHANRDAGQVCIDAEGERLIVDLGTPRPSYPKDFFSPAREKYYVAGVAGHNVLMFGGREMRRGPGIAAEILDAHFEDGRGGTWRADTTALYDGVRSVRRTVTHEYPGIITVLDEAELVAEDDISLRWHTLDRCEPDADGNFIVQGDAVRLVARIERLDDGPIAFRRAEHAWAPPYDTGRLGRPLTQCRESYVEATLRARTCRLLTTFAVQRVGNGRETP